MRIRVGRMLGYGLAGLVLVPVAVTLGVLGLAHLLDPSCGTPGDSGGCEMGAAGAGFVSALPGAVLGMALALWRDWRSAQG